MKNNTKGFLLGLLACLAWAPQPLLIRNLISEGIIDFNIAILKVFISVLILSIVSLFLKKESKQDKIPWREPIFIMGVVGLALNMIFFHKALNYTSGSHVVLLEAFAPVFVVLLGLAIIPERFQSIIHNNKISQLFLIVALGSIGSSLLMLDKGQIDISHESQLFGDLLVGVATISLALFMISNNEIKKRFKMNSVRTMNTYFIGIGIIMIPFINVSNMLNMNIQQWFTIGIIAAISTALPFILWNKAAQYLDISTQSVIINFAAIFTVLLEVIFYNFNISIYIILATILVFTSTYMSVLINYRTQYE